MSPLRQITDHVYWLQPGPPDRPSLCAVVGDRSTLMLDAGSSRSHARIFLDALFAETGTRPSAVVYTHSHWDHVLGGAETGVPVIAQALTAERLFDLAGRDWSDEGLDRRVADGLSSAQHAAHVKEELPAPRTVEVALADIVFRDSLAFDLGGVSAEVRHVGGDHSADSSVIYVAPDRLVFLGDCLYPSARGVLTAESAFRLRDVILGIDADHYVEGHGDSVSSRGESEELFETMRLAEHAARNGLAIEAADEDTQDLVDAFKAGRANPA